jgi:hypothetical protein
MDNIINTINQKFQQSLQSKENPKYHLFFDSFEWWKSTLHKWTQAYTYTNNLQSKPIIKTIKYRKYSPNKVISSNKINQMYKYLTNQKIKDFVSIKKQLIKLDDYLLPSTAKLKTINKVNIVIFGAGPVGLFTALYLNLHHPNIAIVVIDNRIAREGYKLPYSRVTQFGFDITEIEPFIPNIVRWKHEFINGTRKFDFINVFENMLYLCAYQKAIPMIFTKKLSTNSKISEFVSKHDVDYIFDCTGGRLKLKLVIPKDISGFKFKLKKDKNKIKYDKKTNQYYFHENGKRYTHITVVLRLFDKQFKEIPIGNMFSNITNSLSDAKLVKKYNNKCFTSTDYIKLSQQFESSHLQNLLRDVITSKPSNVKFVQLTSFDTCSHHASFAATKYTNRCIYVGLGDTLGNSEYGIYFGLNTAIKFSKWVCNNVKINIEKNEN